MARTLYQIICDQVKRNDEIAAAAPRARARPRLAMDQDPMDPRSSAIYRLVAHLDEAISNPRAKQVAFDLCREALRAGSPGEDAEAEQKEMAAYATRSAATRGAGPDPSTFGQNKNDWPDGPDPLSVAARKIPTAGLPGNAVDSRRRRLAADEAGPLDKLFAERAAGCWRGTSKRRMDLRLGF